jgi:preprotein translocase subunit SecD
MTLLFSERAKEELRAGKSLDEAVKSLIAGREQCPIVDANVCHICCFIHSSGN